MKIIPSHSPPTVAACPGGRLRDEFLFTPVFRPGVITLAWWETDRTVFGGICPPVEELKFNCPPELHAECFFDRREGGVVNLGGPGVARIDGTAYRLETRDALYVGRGAREVSFASDAEANPARLWLLSYPAHAAHPHRHVIFSQVQPDRLGAPGSPNARLLYKLIHPGAFPTCQLVMGITRLEPGSVWNTMPPHTHLRRSEIYLYFDLPPDQAVFHLMGRPDETRHLVVRDSEAVLSPPWSIHSGVGTCSYGFVWGMGGENQEFADMDPVAVRELR